MRFAYIDSQGNEVPIPSVDALALRIELGAIGPDTDLYDAQADHWAPAATHEIYHTLSRDADDDGFVAPPPPVTPSAGAPAAAPPEPERSRRVKKESPEEPEAADTQPPESGPKGEDPSFGLTLAEPPPAPPEGEEGEEEEDDEKDGAEPAAAAPATDDLGLGDMSLEMEPALPVAPESVDDAEDEADGSGFDFGDLGGGGLEMEEPEATPDFSGGMELETPMEFSAPSSGDAAAGGDDLQLEEPMTAFQPDDPPGWMQEAGPDDDDDVMDFSVASADVAEETPVAPAATPTPKPDRAPKDRPSKPKFKRQRSLAGPIVLVVVVLAAGVGGYVGWPILSERLAERGQPDRPQVVMPAIPEALLPQMLELAGQAIATVVTQADQSTRTNDSPPEPDQEWLAGVYMGNASQFPGVQAFWDGIDRLLQDLRSADWQGYHDAYVTAVEGANVSEEDAPILIERADSGFVAAQPLRSQTYGVVQTLVDASLDLHRFLVENEERIQYQPAASSTLDPVLEAVPATPELGEEMWGMVDDITDALDDLGSLDRVTRERLVQALTARLQQVGVE